MAVCLKMSKNVLFFVFIKTTFFGQDSFKIFVFLHYSARFFQVFWSTYFESLLNMMLEYGSFPLTAIFSLPVFLSVFFLSLLWALRFDIFAVFKFHNFGRKITLTSGFHRFVAQTVLYKVVY